MTARPKIGIIVGSTRPVRIGRAIADELTGTIAAAGGEAVMLDLAEIDLPLLDEELPPASGVRSRPHSIAWGEQVAALDGAIFLTPNYNAGYSAAMKNAIDTLSPEWRGLPGIVVSYGWHGGAAAAGQLTQVLDFVGVDLQGDGVQLRIEGDDLDPSTRMSDAAAFVGRFEPALAEGLGSLVDAAAAERAAA